MFVSVSSMIPSFSEHRMIVPCISVGNVGQLTVDLLVNSLHLPRVGYLDHPAILPLVGNDAFDHTHPAGFLHTAAEVYCDADLKLIVLQFRTPLIKGLQADFCSSLLEWTREIGVAEMVVLTSSYAYERRDSQLVGEPFRFLLSSSAGDLFPHLTQQLHWHVLEPRRSQDHSPSSFPSSSSTPSSTSSSLDSTEGMLSQGLLQQTHVFLPGAGLAKRIYKDSNDLGIRLLVLVAFCSQGDNIPDAVAMANKLDSWIELKQKYKEKQSKNTGASQWLYPTSWDMMYGGPSPSNLF